MSFDKERARDACTHIGYGDAVRTVILPAALARIEQLESLCREACEIAARWVGNDGPCIDYRPDEVRIAAIRAELEDK